MTGTTLSMSVTAARVSHASSTESMSAMSAIEHPGIEIGEQHLLVVAGQDVGGLGHEVHPAEHHELGLGLVGGDTGQPEGVATGVGPVHHLVPLVVVAEDHHAGAQRPPWPSGSSLPVRRDDADTYRSGSAFCKRSMWM